MDLTNAQIKDTYGNLVTVGETAGPTTTGRLFNGTNNVLQADASTLTGDALRCTWTTGYFNLGAGTDHYPTWNTQANTGVTFGLERITNGTQGNSSGVDLIKITRNGWYMFVASLHLFDMNNAVEITAKLRYSTNTATLPTAATDLAIIEEKHSDGSSTNSDKLMSGVQVVRVDSSPRYYAFVINTSVTTGSGPFPSDADNTPTSLSVIRLSA